MSAMRNIATIGMFAAVLGLFFGCGEKPVSVEAPQAVSLETQSQESSTDSSLMAEKIDAVSPTGKVSDLMEAATRDSESEKSEALFEENDAKEAAVNFDETNDFGQIYDENEF